MRKSTLVLRGMAGIGRAYDIYILGNNYAMAVIDTESYFYFFCDCSKQIVS